MLAGLAALLVILWLLGFLAFHVAGNLIHILLASKQQLVRKPDRLYISRAFSHRTASLRPG